MFRIILNSKELIRKASHIILSFILILTTAGMTITKHYCGSKLVSINIFTEPDKCCNNSDCCHNETVTVKINADIINLSPVYSFETVSSSISFITAAIFNNIPVLSAYLTTNSSRSSDIPPPATGPFISKLGAFLL